MYFDAFLGLYFGPWQSENTLLFLSMLGKPLLYMMQVAFMLHVPLILFMLLGWIDRRIYIFSFLPRPRSIIKNIIKYIVYVLGCGVFFMHIFFYTALTLEGNVTTFISG